MPLELYTWSVIIFVALLAIYIWKDRKNFQREGIVLLRRTEIGLKFFESQATKHPRFWRAYGNVAAVLSFPIIIGFTFFLVYMLWQFIVTAKPQEVVGLVLPIPIKTAASIPGFVGVPFWHWILAIIIISVVHEFTHGILARLEKVPVKSSGFGFLGPLMMAFVETDDKKMEQKGWKSTARIAAAGPFTNIVVAGIILIAVFALSFTPAAGFVKERFQFNQPTGVFFNETQEGLAAHSAGLQNGTIVAINENEVRSFKDFCTNFPKHVGERGSFTILTFENGTTTQNDYILATRDTGNTNQSACEAAFGIKTSGAIGVSGVKEASQFNPTFLAWLFALNLGLGLANLMPIGPLDGGRIWGEFSKAKLPHGAKIAKYLSRFTIFTLIFLLITALGKNLLG